ncbi:PAS/PAC sensor-containing diguanylate cyclase/phosphodiesterase [Planococcus antarcticus DSM 14505]|uniref:Diguanylate cyclase n=1 Tax=Planococcus antarcticus DSM 14505 TaxID=1185653 RepID=A0A1C7DDM5_9BACL|nr:PAS domain S-box protein [Planococcus antarcticus]ANU09545.1 diguanylate cyclase [Planococcus antarcticus DSM 14505]EIM08255.1 PAS/PAC sensor-containing diguanylate cyclase/phosphodiesterase [Planococcus antarcticus DSM 14505]
MNYFSEKIGQDILTSTALFDLIKDLVFLMEKDHETFRYVYANPSAFKILHLPKTVIGSRIEDVMSPEQAQILIQNYREVHSTQNPVEFIQRIEVESGELIGETVLNPILTENGHCKYILAIVRDVTERERKEQELQETKRELEKDRKRLNSLVENNGNAIFECDQEGNFVSINKMVTEMTGLGEQDLLGTSYMSLIVEEYLEDTISHFEKASNGNTDEFETSIYTSNGQKALFLVNTTPIIVDEIITGVYAIAKEITEQKKLERLLQESEQWYKSLFDNHPHGIFTYDKNGNLTSGNAGAENITGYSMEELAGKLFMRMIVPQDIEKMRDHFYKAIEEKQPGRYELAFHHKNGQQIELQVINIPIIVDEQLVGIHGIVTDVTEINRAQKALIETKEKLEVFWENTTDPVFFINTRGEIMKVNPAFEETFGYSEEEMMNQKGSIVPQYMKADPLAIVKRLKKGETVNSHETMRITKSGELVNIISSYTPVRDENREIIGATIFYKNVTELKKTEKELQKSQEKYKLITESAFDVITLINSSGLIEYVSPSNEKILGYPDTAYIGNPFTTNVHPEDAVGLIETVTSLMDGDKPATIEVRFLHQDGHSIWMEVFPTPVIENGKVNQLLTIARDITERKRLQDKIAKMAFYDHLSGIPNRRTFDDRLQKAIYQATRSGRKVAILMLDGRKFKQINDQFGHDAGDAVIKEMANRLQACVRPIDTAARLGGDEMGVILPELDSLEVAEDTAKRILKSYREPFNFNGFEIKIGAGIGISLYPDDSVNEKQLMKYADMALYEAKKSDQDEYSIYK